MIWPYRLRRSSKELQQFTWREPFGVDDHTPKLQEIFARKGGVCGTKIRPLLDSLSQQHVEAKRETIIRCLMIFLGESSEELIKDYMDVSSDAVKEDQTEQVLTICV